MIYRNIIIYLFLLVYSATSAANCVGSGSIKTCYDANTGNSYTVSELGNSTYVTGTNSRTGNSWSQTSNHIGNTTYTNGVDAEGKPWNSTTTHIGNTIHQSGFDSDGNPFSNTQIQQPILNNQNYDSSSNESSLLDDDDDD